MAQKGVLILGSSGFVGTSLLRYLKSTGVKVFCISTQVPVIDDTDLVKSYVGSLDDSSLLDEVLPQCNIVFYFASHSTPGFSAHKPSIEAESNLLPCLRFLEILEKYNDMLLVYLSSGGAVYGNTSEEFNTENIPLKPLSYYGAGKAAVEKFLLAYQSQTGNKILILRPSNLYGPGQNIREGFGIIPTVFKNIIEKQPIIIWGNGETVRDYLYIDDFINLCLIVVHKRIMPMYRRRIYNVGSGQGVTLNSLLRVVEEITGESIMREYLPKRGVDVETSILNCTRMNEDYDWKAEMLFKDGIIETWEWFQKVYK